jgi:hypothetical protein
VPPQEEEEEASEAQGPEEEELIEFPPRPAVPAVAEQKSKRPPADAAPVFSRLPARRTPPSPSPSPPDDRVTTRKSSTAPKLEPEPVKLIYRQPSRSFPKLHGRKPFTNSLEPLSPFEERTSPRGTARRIPTVNDDLAVFHNEEASEDFVRARRFHPSPKIADATAVDRSLEGFTDFSPIARHRTGGMRRAMPSTSLGSPRRSIAPREPPNEELDEFIRVEREKANEGERGFSRRFDSDDD